MKKKTYIKQGAYQKVENTRGTDIKGALNLNKEVLDTLVDKNVLGTTNCCQYYLTPTTVLADEFESLFDAGAFPPNSFVVGVDEEGNLQALYFIFLVDGGLVASEISLPV